MHAATIAKLVKAKVCKTFMYRFESGWWLQVRSAPVAQLDRVSGYGPEGWGFDSFRARQIQSTSLCHIN